MSGDDALAERLFQIGEWITLMKRAEGWRGFQQAFADSRGQHSCRPRSGLDPDQKTMFGDLRSYGTRTAAPSKRPCLKSDSALHGFDRVSHQIQQYLLDLDPVGQDEVHPRIELKADANAALLGAHQRQSARLLDDLVEAFDPPFALAPRHEIA
jgi:hypothetical protein